MAYRDLRAIADLLGLPPVAVGGVRRNRDGSYSIVIRWPRPGSGAALAMPRWTWRRRVLRFPRRRVEGYRPRGPVRPRDARARRKANQRRFAVRLVLLDPWLPVVERALAGDLAAIDELRAAIRAAAGDGLDLERAA